MKNLLIFAFFTIKSSVDLCIFSMDRPMQLMALFDSIEKYVKKGSLGEVSIVYRATNELSDKAYDVLKNNYFNFIFYKQGKNPKKDFKPITLNVISKSPSNYFMFAVDDNLVRDYLDLDECVQALEKTKSYAFYLRLGKNITYCLPKKMNTPVPKSIKIKENIYSYRFVNGRGDWGYPNNVDMTIYRKKDLNILKSLKMDNPWFESAWAGKANMGLRGLYYEKSKVINVILNFINTRWTYKYSPNKFLDLFYQGYKIDIEKVSKINNKSPHVYGELDLLTKES